MAHKKKSEAQLDDEFLENKHIEEMYEAWMREHPNWEDNKPNDNF